MFGLLLLFQIHIFPFCDTKVAVVGFPASGVVTSENEFLLAFFASTWKSLAENLKKQQTPTRSSSHKNNGALQVTPLASSVFLLWYKHQTWGDGPFSSGTPSPSTSAHPSIIPNEPSSANRYALQYATPSAQFFQFFSFFLLNVLFVSFCLLVSLFFVLFGLSLRSAKHLREFRKGLFQIKVFLM